MSNTEKFKKSIISWKTGIGRLDEIYLTSQSDLNLTALFKSMCENIGAIKKDFFKRHNSKNCIDFRWRWHSQKWRWHSKFEKFFYVVKVILLNLESSTITSQHIGRIVEVLPGKNGIVRAASIQTAGGTLKWPLVKRFFWNIAHSKVGGKWCVHYLS